MRSTEIRAPSTSDPAVSYRRVDEGQASRCFLRARDRHPRPCPFLRPHGARRHGVGDCFVVDATTNTIDTVRADFVPRTVFTEISGDSSVPDMVGTVNLKTGVITPHIIGLPRSV
jgi:hypothetical protein